MNRKGKQMALPEGGYCQKKLHREEPSENRSWIKKNNNRISFHKNGNAVSYLIIASIWWKKINDEKK